MVLAACRALLSLTLQRHDQTGQPDRIHNIAQHRSSQLHKLLPLQTAQLKINSVSQHIPQAAEGDRGIGIDDTLEFQDAIDAFPTNNQSVMDSTLKEMLMSLRGAIHTDMLQLMKQCKSEVDKVRGRVSHIENKMGEFSETFNDMVDAHNDHADDIVWLKSKVADLEDRSRRNSIKIRGIPGSVKTPELTAFMTNIIKEALTDLPLEEVIIDRIHRLRQPRHIPEKLPRDTIARIHYYKVKEKLMYVTRRADNLPECMQGLSFFFFFLLICPHIPCKGGAIS